MAFPTHRLRRLRSTARLRDMVRESRIGREDLIEPFFVTHGRDRRQEIPSMPGQAQLSIDGLVEECGKSLDMGLGAVILFGIPKNKTPTGAEGYAKTGIIPRAVRALKKDHPDLYVIADVCLCEYTDHGHCGVIRDGELINDPSIALLATEALVYADAGVDMVAPSAMADGQVQAIRQALDAAGHELLPIMSYSAKYASAFYGPFRDAAQSAPAFGDRLSYQMDSGNAREALREVDLDLAEGADIVMVKPGLAYLDVLRRVAERSPVPVAVYNVSGEYAMVKAAEKQGWIDGPRITWEILTAFKRAGADLIITYHAREAAKMIDDK